MYKKQRLIQKMKQITLKNIICCVVTLTLNCLISSNIFAAESYELIYKALKNSYHHNPTTDLLSTYGTLKREFDNSANFSDKQRRIEIKIINIYEKSFLPMLEELKVTLDILEYEFEDASDNLLVLQSELDILMTEADSLINTMYSTIVLNDIFPQIDTEYPAHFGRFYTLYLKIIEHLENLMDQ
jgi:hypothetical protein